jgi:hypothetical protein
MIFPPSVIPPHPFLLTAFRQKSAPFRHVTDTCEFLALEYGTLQAEALYHKYFPFARVF